MRSLGTIEDEIFIKSLYKQLILSNLLKMSGYNLGSMVQAEAMEAGSFR